MSEPGDLLGAALAAAAAQAILAGLPAEVVAEALRLCADDLDGAAAIASAETGLAARLH